MLGNSVVPLHSGSLPGVFRSVGISQELGACIFYALCAVFGTIYGCIAWVYALYPGPILIINAEGVRFPLHSPDAIRWSQIRAYQVEGKATPSVIRLDLKDRSSWTAKRLAGKLLSLPFVTVDGPFINLKVIDRSFEDVEAQFSRYIR